MRRTIAALAIAGGAFGVLAAPMSPAEAATPTANLAAAGSCYGGWHDSNTYGEGCKGYPSGYKLQASAQCKNGTWAYGNKVSISSSSYTWSYAYCAGKGGYKLGTGGYIILSPL